MKTRISWIIFLLCAGFFVPVVLMDAATLPAKVATHFNGAGKPDGWMARDAHLRGTLLIGLGVALVVIGACHLMRFLPPSLINVPNATYWRAKENYARACAFMERWSLWLASLTTLWLTALTHEIVLANRTVPVHLPTERLVMYLVPYFALFLGMITYLIWWFTRIKSHPAPTSSSSQPVKTIAVE